MGRNIQCASKDKQAKTLENCRTVLAQKASAPHRPKRGSGRDSVLRAVRGGSIRGICSALNVLQQLFVECSEDDSAVIHFAEPAADSDQLGAVGKAGEIHPRILGMVDLRDSGQDLQCRSCSLARSPRVRNSDLSRAGAGARRVREIHDAIIHEIEIRNDHRVAFARANPRTAKADFFDVTRDSAQRDPISRGEGCGP